MPREVHPADFLYKTEEQRQREQTEWELQEARAKLQEQAAQAIIQLASSVAPSLRPNAKPPGPRKARGTNSPSAVRRLRDFMTAGSLSSEAIAQRAGSSAPTIRRFLRGEPMRQVILEEIAKLLHLSGEQLLAPPARRKFSKTST